MQATAAAGEGAPRTRSFSDTLNDHLVKIIAGYQFNPKDLSHAPQKKGNLQPCCNSASAMSIALSALHLALGNHAL